MPGVRQANRRVTTYGEGGSEKNHCVGIRKNYNGRTRTSVELVRVYANVRGSRMWFSILVCNTPPQFEAGLSEN